MKPSICIEMICPNLTVEERIVKVAEHGFEYIEIWYTGDKDMGKLKKQLKDNGVKLTGFAAHGKTSPMAGEDITGFLEEVDNAFKIAHEFECDDICVHSQEILPDLSGKPISGTYEKKYLSLYIALDKAADMAEKEGITLGLEALNNPVDHPGYFIGKSDIGFEIVNAVGNPHLKLLYDIYHMQIAEGNVIETMEKNIDKISCIHAADVPGRHEPGTGELNYSNIISRLDKIGFKGALGFEYSPAKDDDEALRAIKKLF